MFFFPIPRIIKFYNEFAIRHISMTFVEGWRSDFFIKSSYLVELLVGIRHSDAPSNDNATINEIFEHNTLALATHHWPIHICPLLNEHVHRRKNLFSEFVNMLPVPVSYLYYLRTTPHPQPPPSPHPLQHHPAFRRATAIYFSTHQYPIWLPLLNFFFNTN